MSQAIKAEILKILTIRSTYVWTILTVLLTGLFAFYFEGYRGNTGSAASTLGDTAIEEIMRNAAGLAAQTTTIIAVLFMGHEYRYNMIMHSLTINASRSRFLAAKAITISLFAVVFGLLTIGLAVVFYLIGLQLRDASLPAQSLDSIRQLGYTSFYFAASALFALLVAAVLRNLVAAIVFMLFVPGTVEGLLSIVLKENTVYLPFTALGNVIGQITGIGDPITQTEAAAVVAAYLAAGWLAGWLLFARRDAS